MADEIPMDDLARRYLLGQLGETAQDEIEQRLIESAEVQERIAMVESELVDDYVAGRLAPPDRERFEQRYLTHAEGVRKVDHARLLRRRMTGGVSFSRPVRRRAWLRPWQAVAASLLVATLAGLLSWQSRRELPLQEAEIAADRDRERELAERRRDAESQLEELPQEPPAATPTPLPEPSIVLAPGALRDPAASLQTVAASGPVRLELAFPVKRRLTYRAVIQTPDQVEVWSAEGLPVETRAGSTVLVCRVPALQPGDYILRLHAREGQGEWESVADYTFRVAL